MSTSFGGDVTALRRVCAADQATTSLLNANATLDQATGPVEGAFGRSAPGREAEREYRELHGAATVAHDQIAFATGSYGDRLVQVAQIMEDTDAEATESAAHAR